MDNLQICNPRSSILDPQLATLMGNDISDLASDQQRTGYRIITRRGRSNGTPDPGPSAISYGLYATPRNSAQLDYYRPRPYLATSDVRVSLDDYDWRDILNYSRLLFAQVGTLGAAILQKNTYAVGDAWDPQFTGENAEWGKLAADWLQNTWYPNCDLRGGLWNFKRNLFLSSVALDVDGDDLMVMVTADGDWPALKFYSAHDIGSRGATAEMAGGEYDGAKVRNGVICDSNNRAIGYHLFGEGPAQDLNISAYNSQMLFDPEWRSQDRGIPRVGRVILDWFDVQDIDVFLKRGVKLDSSIGLTVSTESGEAQFGANWIGAKGSGSQGATDIKIEQRQGGEIFYLRPNRGEKIEPMKSERPHPNTEAFLQRIERRGLAAIGWFFELLDPSKIGGASVRLIQDQARHSISHRQGTLYPRALRAVQFAIGKAIDTGRLPHNPIPGDFLKWGFEMPAQLTVDTGYDEMADRENLKLSITTLAAICQKKGNYWVEVREQRRKENINLIDAACDLLAYAKSKGQDLTFREARDMMQRDSVMGSVMQQPLNPEPGQGEPPQKKDEG